MAKRTDRRRAEARRRAWGRGPMILRFEPLEGRAMLSTAAPSTALPDLASQSFQAPSNLNWGASFQAQGVVVNHGNAPAAKAFQVDIYASTTPAVGSTSVLLGEATIAAGLQPGATSAYNVPLTLPSASLSGLSPSGAFYLAAVIDPQGAVGESTRQNNADTGAGTDYELITPPPVTFANLVGTGQQVTPTSSEWGGTVTLTQQITNEGNADAPATRALVVLTPGGAAPGTSADFTIDSLNVPAIPAGQSATVSRSITLPQVPPSSFAGVSNYTLSIVPDADYVTNVIYPHAAAQGAGLDQSSLTINTPSYVSANRAALPQLAVTAVAVDSQAIKWGQQFQVASTLTNSGSGDPGPFLVRYVLVGPGGSIANALFLADTTVSDLAPGATQNVVTTLTLPATVPDGGTVNGAGQARVAVIIDPQNVIDENRAGQVGESNIIQLNVVGTNGQVTPAATIATPSPTPTSTPTPTPSPTATIKTPTSSTPLPGTNAAIAAAARAAAAANATKASAAATAAAFAKRNAARKPAKHTLSHNLKVVPKHIEDYFKKTFHIK